MINFVISSDDKLLWSDVHRTHCIPTSYWWMDQLQFLPWLQICCLPCQKQWWSKDIFILKFLVILISKGGCCNLLYVKTRVTGLPWTQFSRVGHEGIKSLPFNQIYNFWSPFRFPSVSAKIWDSDLLIRSSPADNM